MLKIQVSDKEYFDEAKGKFIKPDAVTIELEHSLVSISKWESIWEKPFLDKSDKTEEQMLSYIECMAINPDFDPESLKLLDVSDVKRISSYISANMTATWFSDTKKGGTNNRIITSELVYYWMIALNIPFECQHWHLSRLLTLIEVCNRENSPKKNKRMGRSEIDRRRALNEQRRAEMGHEG